jgi:hypothetical protein
MLWIIYEVLALLQLTFSSRTVCKVDTVVYLLCSLFSNCTEFSSSILLYFVNKFHPENKQRF